MIILLVKKSIEFLISGKSDHSAAVDKKNLLAKLFNSISFRND